MRSPNPAGGDLSRFNEADFTLKTKSGEEKGVALGAVLGVHFKDWQKNKSYVVALVERLGSICNLYLIFEKNSFSLPIRLDTDTDCKNF